MTSLFKTLAAVTLWFFVIAVGGAPPPCSRQMRRQLKILR